MQAVHFQPIGIARQLNAGDREFAESGILKTHVLFVRKSERTASRVGRVSPVFGNRTVTNAVKWEVKNGKTGIGLWRLGERFKNLTRAEQIGVASTFDICSAKQVASDT
ncbi:MAG: hypothetical protein DMG97_39665 [Acidobacteria bacterium]|nr:MAG: hypothetical protein DMG97_39665 [Acidobacteriota bacterium]